MVTLNKKYFHQPLKIKTAMTQKILLPIFISAVFIASCVAGPNYNGYMQPVYVGPGIGLGTIIAVVISWGRNKSILWAIIHGLLGWLYVIYALIVKNK